MRKLSNYRSQKDVMLKQPFGSKPSISELDLPKITNLKTKTPLGHRGASVLRP